ncbi:hypothetical protein B0H21DRAFT_299287 [Amylocystis lapponica]|nr:hypothetical protein B0H21DRAFT_299287 [Amylocystis lapponica]
MTTTTMHFGPEWMRTKQGPSRPAPSPPLTVSPTPPGASTYSALVTPTTATAPERRDVVHPFRYSKEEMLRIYKEGGGRGGLGLEVERWEGIVREVGYEPAGLKEPGEAEKKIFAGPLNSEIRRRQSTDFLSPLATSSDRPKLNHAIAGAGSPMRERIGSFMGRRRDSTDQPPLPLPRKLSLSSMQGPLASPREAALPSPRGRIGQTPGFDGVLNESWASRRRAAEAASKPGGVRGEKDTLDYLDSKDTEIKEEEEGDQHSTEQQGDENSAAGSTSVLPPGPPLAGVSNGMPRDSLMSSANTSNVDVASLPLGSRNASPAASAAEITGDPPNSKPGVSDLGSVEWSYLDPQGQVQGPFLAELMQRWYNEGYFAPDLMMKRTHLDMEWISVGDMLQRVGDRPIFLTPIDGPVVPPGLSRRSDSLLDGSQPGSVPDRERRSPYQPVPTSTLRSLTLDSYLQNGSSASNSPSSSFGVNGYVNGSPDPGTLDGRMNPALYNDPVISSRAAGFAAGSESPLAMGAQRRQTFGDGYESSLGARPSLTNLTSGRGMSVDGLGFSGMDGATSSSADSAGPFLSNFPGPDAGNFSRLTGVGLSRGPQDVSALNGHATPTNFATGDYGPIGGFANPPSASRVVHRDVYAPERLETHPGIGLGPYSNGSTSSYAPNGQQLSQIPSLPYPSPHTNHPFHPVTPLSERQPQMASHPLPISQQPQHSFVSSPNYAGSQSQWAPQDASILRRPGPFDVDHPTASNTYVASSFTPPQVSYSRATLNAAPSNQSPWFNPSQGAVHDGWGGNLNSLTVANLGHHNQQHQHNGVQSQAGTPDDAKDMQNDSTEVPPEASLQLPTAPPATPSSPVEPRASQKLRRKSTAPPTPVLPVQPPASKVTSVTTTAVRPPSPTPQGDAKLAWSTEDENKKAKPSGVTLGLREIQEAETRKLEARKAAERERDRAARAATGPVTQSEDFQPFTTSWGLPTSQAGTARPSAAAKDPNASPLGTSPATPVWTNASKPPVAKKTMKEIQEEEEKQKKHATKEKETVAAAARRAYAESTNKSTAPVQLSGGAWTTVGASGKSAIAAIPAAPVRPVVTTSVSAKISPSTSSTSVVAASFSNTRLAAVPAPSRPAAVAKVAPSKSDEAPVPPSHDFLKWLSESMKGLNNSVNLEDITAMLLSFPLDPDPSTVELISDLIYASSTTLDGRRFASDFVSRRKADAASRPKGAAPISASGKSMSIADVVKAQPKPAQNEWGGFKVVNKKKKGGRA